jgi:hypothetical protein
MDTGAADEKCTTFLQADPRHGAAVVAVTAYADTFGRII